MILSTEEKDQSLEDLCQYVIKCPSYRVPSPINKIILLDDPRIWFLKHFKILSMQKGITKINIVHLIC